MEQSGVLGALIDQEDRAEAQSKTEPLEESPSVVDPKRLFRPPKRHAAGKQQEREQRGSAYFQDAGGGAFARSAVKHDVRGDQQEEEHRFRHYEAPGRDPGGAATSPMVFRRSAGLPVGHLGMIQVPDGPT